MKIAIIGSGVSGLSNAYFILKEAMKSGGQIPEIKIYEKSDRIGGNAHSMPVILKDPNGNPINRWVDMGVNDFNQRTYSHMVALWKELDIFNPFYKKPLINSESFSHPDGGDRYAVSNVGKITIGTGSTANEKDLYFYMDQFKKDLWDWYAPYQDDERGAPDFTVGDFVKKYNYPDDFIYTNLFPRINGMYYTEEYSTPDAPGPSKMPMWMVAHYYVLQEGYGNTDPSIDTTWDRQYFVNGTTHWIDRFAEVLTNRYNIDIITEQLNLRVIRQGDGKLRLIRRELWFDTVDKVIFCNHADQIEEMVDPNDPQNQVFLNALAKFGDYSESASIVHQDYSVFPLQQGYQCFETYNIHNYWYDKQHLIDIPKNTPYTITYLVNMHQNDAASGITNPWFFNTLNPQATIDTNKILLQPNGDKAICDFRHAKLNFNSMKGQIELNDYQFVSKEDVPIMFSGSFTIGAGLHEECVIHAEEIAKKMYDGNYESDQGYQLEKGERGYYAPRYILEALGHKIEE